MILRTIILLLSLGGICRIAARQPVGIAYCDLDKLYDTVPSPFCRDDDYTPQGRFRWTAARYERKIRQTAALIDSMALPVVALWGVENERVARDIAAACEGDYVYLHRTLDALDGMDFVLLYYGDRFFPERIEEGRRYLCIEGLLDRNTVALVLCAESRMAEWVVRDLREERPQAKLLVLGRSDIADPLAYGLRDAHERAERAGRGTRLERGRWRMRERILADTAFRICGGDVFARDYLLDAGTGAPLPTFSGTRYRGGFSRSLPVYIYIE